MLENKTQWSVLIEPEVNLDTCGFTARKQRRKGRAIKLGSDGDKRDVCINEIDHLKWADKTKHEYRGGEA